MSDSHKYTMRINLGDKCYTEAELKNKLPDTYDAVKCDFAGTTFTLSETKELENETVYIFK